VGIVGGVHHASGDVGTVTGLQELFFSTYPLLCLTAEDVDDLFTMRVAVKGVAATCGHGGAHAEELFCLHQVRAA
jgi:hypothetical protein